MTVHSPVIGRAAELNQTLSHFNQECADTSARIADDMQEVILLIEAKAKAWAADGLLDITRRSNRWDDETREWTTRTVVIPASVAVAELTELVRESMRESMNRSAREARDVAGGKW